MNKVKISKLKDVKLTDAPKEFNISIKSKNENLKSTIVVDFIKQTIKVDFGRSLSETERLSVLKESFYFLCITESKRNRGKYNTACRRLYF